MGSGNNGNSPASKFEDTIHGTYASTYVPLRQRILSLKIPLYLMVMVINLKIMIFISQMVTLKQ